MNTQNVTLWLDKQSTVGEIVRLGQMDDGGTTIVAAVFDGVQAAELDGMTAEFVMRLPQSPDGPLYVRDNDCTVDGNTITYVVDESHCCSVAGVTDEAYFIIHDGDSTYSTSRFRVKVLRTALDGAVPTEPYDSAIEEAIENANEAADEAREAAGGTVPLMTASQRGGAKLGDGLALTGEALGVDPLTTTDVDTVTSDGSLTSSKALTGTMLTYLWSKIKAKFASLVNGAVSVAQGGTGATTAALARTNLDAAQSNGASGTLKSAEDDIDSLETGIDDIEASLAYVESTTATANHAVGDYFMLGNVLMKATAAIAAGETITASNATPVTVQGQIDTLKDSVDHRVRFVDPVKSSGISAWGSGDSYEFQLTARKEDQSGAAVIFGKDKIQLYKYDTSGASSLWTVYSATTVHVNVTEVSQSGVTLHNLRVYRCGNVVEVTMRITCTVTQQTITIATGLPKPYGVDFINETALLANSLVTVNYGVKLSGELSVYFNAVSSGRYIAFTYLAE